MKRLLISFTILSMLCFYSCSNDDSFVTNDGELSNEDVLVINSIEELDALLAGLNLNEIGEDAEHEVFDNPVKTKVSIIPMFVGGYDKITAYSGKDGLKFITTDGPTAQKLGIKWNHYYYITISQVNKQIVSNGFNPSIAESPYCGLMLNTAMDDFLTCRRGYKGFYYPSTKVYSMNTSVMCFKDRSSAGTMVWYPTNPSNFEWRFNAVWK